ncbi:MAG: hypothetical protein M3Y56_13310, partial [Armatimonadota bacterium]|nr:hypothetical protein [Armatimonadota bacterium]
MTLLCSQYATRMTAAFFALTSLAPCAGFAASSEPPILVAPAPTPNVVASPIPRVSATTDTGPPGFVTEMLPIRYRDCQELLSAVDRSLDPTAYRDPLEVDYLTAQSAPAAGQNKSKTNQPTLPGPTHLLNLLPDQSVILPYPLTNSFLVRSTPAGVKLAKLLIGRADTRPKNILVRLSVVSLEPTAPPAGQASPYPFS